MNCVTRTMSCATSFTTERAARITAGRGMTPSDTSPATLLGRGSVYLVGKAYTAMSVSDSSYAFAQRLCVD